jgi:hypothetical protein
VWVINASTASVFLFTRESAGHGLQELHTLRTVGARFFYSVPVQSAHCCNTVHEKRNTKNKKTNEEKMKLEKGTEK